MLKIFIGYLPANELFRTRLVARRWSETIGLNDKTFEKAKENIIKHRKHKKTKPQIPLKRMVQLFA